MSPKLENLREVVCLVTGASRGMGRAIAIGLGECGATVYITARTVKPKPGAARGDIGSLEETAAEINARGGVCLHISRIFFSFHPLLCSSFTLLCIFSLTSLIISSIFAHM